MPRKVKVVNINDDSTYGDVAEAIVENEKAENEPAEETKTEELGEPDPPKPKARAKRVPKPKDVVDDTLIEPEPTPEQVEPKPKAKRAPKVKVVELPPVMEEPVEKSKGGQKTKSEERGTDTGSTMRGASLPSSTSQDRCTRGSLSLACLWRSLISTLEHI